MAQDSPYDVGWAFKGAAVGFLVMVAAVAAVWWVTAGDTWMRERKLNARTREFLDCVSQPNAELQAGCLVSRHGWAADQASTVVVHWNQAGRREALAEILKRDLKLR